MNMLLWKEWRQNWLLLVGAVGVALVILIGDAVYQLSANTADFSIADLRETVLVAWASLALLCGSSMISPEVGSGSLRFLDILPVTRSRIWWTKFGFGLALLAGCLIAAYVSNTLVCSALVAERVVRPESALSSGQLLGCAAAAVALYAVGFLASVLFDRTISAFMAAIGIAVVMSAAAQTTLASCLRKLVIVCLVIPGRPNPVVSDNSQQLAIICLFILGIPVIMAMSYTIFTRGETLQTRKRYRVLAGFIVPVVVLVAAAAAALALIWQ